jgi:hypothetical protein
MITVGTLGSNLKRKYVSKNKPGLAPQEKKDLLESVQEDYPTTDAEIDAVYGAGAATRAMDEVYEKNLRQKMKKK